MALLSTIWNNKKLLVSILAVLVLAYAFVRISMLQADKDALTDQLNTAQYRVLNAEARASAAEADLREGYKAVLDREQANAAFVQQLVTEKDALRQAFAADPESCEWSREKIPAGVAEALGCGK